MFFNFHNLHNFGWSSSLNGRATSNFSSRLGLARLRWRLVHMQQPGPPGAPEPPHPAPSPPVAPPAPLPDAGDAETEQAEHAPAAPPVDVTHTESGEPMRV